MTEKNLAQVQDWLDHTKSISDFRAAIRSQVRRLWLGEVTAFSFFDGMNVVLSRHLRIAWNEGAATCGIAENEMTTQEINARNDFINAQFSFLPGFADAIEENSKASGGLLGPLLDRANLWVNRYEEIKNKARAMVCKDAKLIWKVGPTEHCEDCLNLNGRVYRASVWNKNGLLPRSSGLACGGFNCQCTLEQTDQPLTRGRPPSLRGRK